MYVSTTIHNVIVQFLVIDNVIFILYTRPVHTHTVLVILELFVLFLLPNAFTEPMIFQRSASEMEALSCQNVALWRPCTCAISHEHPYTQISIMLKINWKMHCYNKPKDKNIYTRNKSINELPLNKSK